MCGLAGALVFNNSTFLLSEKYLIEMRDTMILRGPDDSGLWISEDQKIGFGHRRLSIIDLSDAAIQPMHNHDKTITLVFNGEIYNHLEIRKELIELGHSNWLTDHSDTEVIIKAYEEWGIDCVQKFRGMFSIALWDAKSQNLWFIRDRLGVKPLYYTILNNRIIFASEIKALLTDIEYVASVNEEGLFHYLSFLTVPAPETLFKDIYKLPPATYAKVNTSGEISFTKYWDVLDNTEDLSLKSEDEISTLILSELSTAIKYRKVSDVPVGVFLSGGIDSSTNTALFSKDEDKPIKTFSIGYKGDYPSYKNELHYAKSVANQFKTDHHEKLLTQEDLLNFLPKMIQLQDEPLADPVCVPVYYVSKLARDNGVIVCQVGEGADELFIGYRHWIQKLKVYKYDSYPIPRFLKKGLMKIMGIFGYKNHGYFEHLRRANLGQPIFWSGSECFTHNVKMTLLSKRLRKNFQNQTSFDAIEPLWDHFNSKSKSKHPIDWMTFIDLNLRLPELLLMRVDKMSMGTSLEARVPFLDHKFVELAMSMPSHLKYKEGESKRMLKKAVRGIIPDEIIDRRKQGFAAPIDEWYNDILGVKAEKILKEFCNETDFFDWNSVQDLLNSSDKSSSWPLLNFALWYQLYINKKDLCEYFG
jgi:asparagine synthase (glutamine-hydrolysing)